MNTGACDVCLGDFNDADPVDFHAWKVVRARKAHVCGECGLDIVPGQKYERVAAKADGDFFETKVCLICCELRTAFSCDPERAICYGELWHEIKEHLFPKMTTGCLQKIRTAEAKDFLIKRWNEWKFKAVASTTETK